VTQVSVHSVPVTPTSAICVRGWGFRTVVRFFVQGDLRHNIKPSFDRRHMSEGTRHFISREWLPTMRTVPIDGEPRIFLYSSSIKRGMTLRRKAKFHAEMHSPPVAFPWPKFLYFQTTGIQTLFLVLCIGNNARNHSNATWRFRLWDLLNWYLIMRVLGPLWMSVFLGDLRICTPFIWFCPLNGHHCHRYLISD